MKKLMTISTIASFLLVALVGCKEKDNILDKKGDMPSIVVVAPGHTITDHVIQCSLLKETPITVDYTITTSSKIKQVVQSVDDVQQQVVDAVGLEKYTGQLVINAPYADKTISLQLEVTDDDLQTTKEVLSVVIDASGDFLVDGDVQVVGSVNQGEELTISGSGFGSGPNVIIYDDFEGGNHNDPIPLNSPLIGAWTTKSTNYVARYYDYAYSGNTSYSMQDELATTGQYGGKRTELKVRFDDTQEVFLSYQLTVPPGKNFPGAPSRDQWGTASHWKMTWLMDTDNGFKDNDGRADLCIPTNGQAQALQVSGNTDKIGWVASLDDLFDMDGFNRITTWLRADPAAPQTQGYTWIQWLSAKTMPIFTREHIKPVFNGEASGSTSYQWNQLNVPGWFGNSLVNPGGVYDDVYLATGPNAPARVEVGDAPVYANCTELSIMPSTSWTDSQIKVIVKTKGQGTISQQYLFVFDGNNELITGGIAIP
ncbi:hypothetical protein [Sphingobacterium pedocola]|uniref:DUF5018 domain-containing protein n=1 Tax=Sphingobacterium pedocola TaxID=2082722 RepID=A0ABR9TDV5_9SPHI|nr:hypothetical protein [Sphingobacterium pedocola]MBE8723244.1 hypothetical protein [Sphingobacterium pedocola]